MQRYLEQPKTATPKPGLIQLTPAIKDLLGVFACFNPIDRAATHGIDTPTSTPLPPKAMRWLRQNNLKPRGFSSEKWDDAACVVPHAFAAQFVVAYHALAGMPDAKPQKALNSYGLKHSVGNIWGIAHRRGVYICNGALILAALARGYPVRPSPDKINANINLHKTWHDVMERNIAALQDGQRAQA
jgi:hypothetical protein